MIITERGRSKLANDTTVDYPTDFLGNEIKVGDVVVRACTLGRSPVLELRTVVKVEGTTVWTSTAENGRATKVNFNARMLVIDKASKF